MALFSASTVKNIQGAPIPRDVEPGIYKFRIGKISSTTSQGDTPRTILNVMLIRHPQVVEEGGKKYSYQPVFMRYVIPLEDDEWQDIFYSNMKKFLNAIENFDEDDIDKLADRDVEDINSLLENACLWARVYHTTMKKGKEVVRNEDGTPRMTTEVTPVVHEDEEEEDDDE